MQYFLRKLRVANLRQSRHDHMIDTIIIWSVRITVVYTVIAMIVLALTWR